MRVRYWELKTPSMDWLQLSPEELEGLLEGTEWSVSRVIGEGPSYIAIIDRRTAQA